MKLTGTEKIDRGELSNHEPDGRYKQAAIAVIYLYHPAQPMKAKHRHLLNICLSYSNVMVIRLFDSEAKFVDPSLTAQGPRF